MSNQMDEEEFARRLGTAIRDARQRLDFTQATLAERIGTDPETVSRFERGKAMPSLARLLSIAEALSVRVGDLLGSASPRETDEWDALHRTYAELPEPNRRRARQIMAATILALKS